MGSYSMKNYFENGLLNRKALFDALTSAKKSIQDDELKDARNTLQEVVDAINEYLLMFT